MCKYNKPVYSKEAYEYWGECSDRAQEFASKHSSETVKDYNVQGFTIRCIQRKYDSCMNKKNEYGVQVWTCNPDEAKADEIFDNCISNEWFDNAKDANEYYKTAKLMCC